jgi:hypothetical protein
MIESHTVGVEGAAVPECPKCGGHLRKVHRQVYERLFCAAAYACRHCNFRVRRFRPWWTSICQFTFSRYTRCIRCGTVRVHRVYKRDRIDEASWHPFSLIQQILGAPKNKCPLCRLRYHDFRPLAPAARANQKAAGESA